MLHNLKQLRKQHKVTQHELAMAVGSSQQSINKYENHAIEPDIATLIAIADYFHTSVDYLIGHHIGIDESHHPVKLSGEELDILNSYRTLSPREKESIQLILENYRTNKPLLP